MRSFKREIPSWINKVVEGNPDIYLFQTQKQFLLALEQVYFTSRLNPSDFMIFQLSLSLIRQQEKNEFYEESISHHMQEIIALRSEIKKLKRKKVKQ